MTAIQKESLRKAILRVLDQNRTRFGLGAPALILQVSTQFNLRVPEPDLLDELDYLVHRPAPLVEEVRREISPENRTWRITSAGLAFVDTL